MPLYIFLTKDVFALIPSGAKYSLEYNVFPNLIGKGIFGLKCDGDFIDIGILPPMEQQRSFLKGLKISFECFCAPRHLSLLLNCLERLRARLNCKKGGVHRF